MARIWRDAGMGEVIGLTTSQTARNVLAEAGVTRAYNTARFLGHLRKHREARGPVPVEPGSLLVLDEASMMSLADMAAILAIACAHDCKVVITGDHEQLAAVEGGGGMMLLARRLGYVQLAEPQRFTHAWERDATLRLRAGDITVLAEYEQHGRLRGGTAEEATEQAYRGWLADYLDGKDTLLLARTEEQARELSRRARDDLIRYGIVSAGPRVRLAAGEQASTGDLVMARRNTHAIRAGQHGRDLANRDILQITAIPADGMHAQVRRLTGHDPGTGQALLVAAVPGPKALPRRSCNPRVRDHRARRPGPHRRHRPRPGRRPRRPPGTVRGHEPRPRRQPRLLHHRPQPGRRHPRRQPPRPRTRPRRAARPRTRRPATRRTRPVTTSRMPVLDPVTVLAGVLARDGSELSATETLQHELSHADHLGVLGGIWDDVTRRVQATRFEHALRGALPTDLASQALDDPACTWLWRSLREAEAAGLDGAHILQQAVASRTMSGARDVARVLDSRVRHMLDGVQPQPFRPWTERVPSTDSADLDRYLRELAEAMDDRVRRLGEHAAATQPSWARQALGPVPSDPVARLEWEQRASLVAAYRERYGYADPADPIGPAPAKTSPEARAAWHAALSALGRVNGIDLRACTDGELWLRRSTYERETAWAPPYVAEELRLARIAERDAHVNAIRAEHELRAAHDDQTAPGTSNSPGSGVRCKLKPHRSRHLRRRPGNPAPMGSSHRTHPPDRHRRRPRTTPPPPRSADPRRSAHTPPKPTASPALRICTRPTTLTASRNRPSTSTPTSTKPMPSVLSGSPCKKHRADPRASAPDQENASTRPGHTRRPGAHAPTGCRRRRHVARAGLADCSRPRARRRAPASSTRRRALCPGPGALSPHPARSQPCRSRARLIALVARLVWRM